MVSFIEELLAEAEVREKIENIAFNKIQADQALGAIGTLEDQMADVNTLADDEIKLIEQYRQSEIARVEKKLSWLVFNLENFARKHSAQTNEKTLRLPHGTLALRKGRDKVEIENLEQFLKIAAKYNLLRTTPEEHVPDLKALSAYLTRTGEILPGVKVTPATINFSYQTIKLGERLNEQQ